MAGITDLVRHLESERKRRGMTREYLCDRAGYSKSTWCDAVNEKRCVSASCLHDFAQALGFKLMLWRDGVRKDGA